jgi:hypothetical protein
MDGKTQKTIVEPPKRRALRSHIFEIYRSGKLVASGEGKTREEAQRHARAAAARKEAIA